jgi:formate dehydrogenase major subunit
VSDKHIPIRAGSDVVLLGALINHVLTNDLWFKEYVVAYTNAATLINEDFKDTEDLGGLFSGFDPETGQYDMSSWAYQEEGHDDGDGTIEQPGGGHESGANASERAAGDAHGNAGPALEHARVKRDETLQDPHTVFQILKRHYSRYTPEMVRDVCGITVQDFHYLADSIVENSGRERTTCFAYAVGWTQHTLGAQFIRTATILQLLMGNVGRPGSGIMALRGHASIQGSTDIPTLFNLLPGYLPMPHAHQHENLDSFVAADAAERGYWANMRSYMVSLLKAYWGAAATAENDFCFDYLPRLTGSHTTYETVQAQLDGTCKGYFLLGENPAVGSANTSMQRRGMANLDWLVVRDFSLIESATWWKDGPEIATDEMRTGEIGTEVFFFPAAAHTEKSGSFTNTNRLLQWHFAAVEPGGDARSDLWFMLHLGRLIREKLAGSADPADRPVLDLTWNYPTTGPLDEPVAEAVLAEINGWDSGGEYLSSYEQLKDDGSTTCGCWIYCGCYADGVNQPARRKSHVLQSISSREWGWAWPANRREMYNRASADPQGKPWSQRKALVWWDEGQGSWVGDDVPDFPPTRRPDYQPDEDARGVDALSGVDPFIMQADGKGWLFVPAGLTDGPLPTHYEPQDSPARNLLYSQQRNPVRQLFPGKHNRYHPDPDTPGAEVYPYVITTYRLTEHFTSGTMSRWQPYLSELQPEFFCEVSPQLAALRGLRHHDWATIVTARGAVEARVMVTARMTPLTVDGRTVHQIGLPYHWGPNGLSTGDSMNELSSIALDPNVHIQEGKALTADIRPGRRPRGPDLPAFLEAYRKRAGITERTGTEGAVV